MKLQSALKKTVTFSLLAVVLALSTTSSALAHVTITPNEVVTAEYQTFTVSVPNEKDIPTVSVRVVIPEAIKSATPTQQAGWQITKETANEGDDLVTKAIIWAGGSIDAGTRGEFTFSTKTPDEATELQWKAYQTYADGTVVAWDQDGEDGHRHGADQNVGPFSVTKVVAETAKDTASEKASQAAADAKTVANRALYVSVVAAVVGVTTIFLITRKK